MKNQKQSLMVLVAITAVVVAAIMLFVWPGLLLEGVSGPNAPRSTPTAHGDFTYVTIEEKDPDTDAVTRTVTITEYHGNGAHAVVPAMLGGAPVTAIGEGAFARSEKLTEITLPAGVTVLGEGAFEECTALQTVHLSSGLNKIGERAFRFCSSLTEIEIPEGVETIGDMAFFDCTALTEAKLPESLTRIGKDAFASCVRLETVNLPEGLLEIGDGAFRKCMALGALALPGGDLTIGENVFFECPNLVLDVPAGSPAEAYCLKNELIPAPTPTP
ncbi:MAG: leucine-rich repeat domain-containing protein [Clostridia bacterium]|nr:leucine-rich repeat domain-containing protein [Clostridia bacterium]